MASSVCRCRCQFILTEFLAPSPRQFVTLFQTASRTAAVEITFISAAQKWSLFRGCR